MSLILGHNSYLMGKELQHQNSRAMHPKRTYSEHKRDP